jgi:hypothetical protein
MSDQSNIWHRECVRGYEVCVVYTHPDRSYPIYHGPRLAPERAHPFSPALSTT